MNQIGASRATITPLGMKLPATNQTSARAGATSAQPLMRSFLLTDYLLVVAFVVDILTPLLVWKRILPDEVRFISQFALLGVAAVAYMRMLAQDRIPSIVLIAGGVSIFGMAMALLEGQTVLATLWGWWELYEFWFVGLYLYTAPQAPRLSATQVFRFCLGLLLLQVAAQIGLFFSGVAPGDFLAGTLGPHGVRPLLILISLVVALVFGRWLIYGDTKLLLVTLSISTLASILGELKIFPMVVCLLGGLALVLQAVQGKVTVQVVQVALLLPLLLLAFVFGYNQLVPAAERRGVEEYLFDTELRENYLGRVRQDDESYIYRFGRNSALTYGLASISSGDWARLFFGYGIGARTESKTLGLVGSSLERENLESTSGTSLLIMLEEGGLVGFITILCILAGIGVALFQDIRREPNSEMAVLRYGLLLFTCLWPVWLWYAASWYMRAPMLIYWMLLGYVFHRAHRPQPSDIVIADQTADERFRQLFAGPESVRSRLS